MEIDKIRELIYKFFMKTKTLLQLLLCIVAAIGLYFIVHLNTSQSNSNDAEMEIDYDTNPFRDEPTAEIDPNDIMLSNGERMVEWKKEHKEFIDNFDNE